VVREGVEPPTPAFSELVFPVFLTTSMVAMGLPNTGKYHKNERTVGDYRGWFGDLRLFGATAEREEFYYRHF
jgi:hypothetical protein